MGWLDGYVACVTGGAASIGRGVVEEYLAEGAQVAVLDRDGAAVGVDRDGAAADVLDPAAGQLREVERADLLAGRQLVQPQSLDELGAGLEQGDGVR